MSFVQKLSPKLRRRLRRIALGLLVPAALALAWILFLPVPIAWAVRAGAARALPARGPLGFAIDGATFRWHLGGDDAAIELRGMAITGGGQPLLSVGKATIEIPKSGLWHGRALPRTTAIDDVTLTIDSRRGGAVASMAAAPAPPVATTVPPAPAKPLDLADLAAVLPLRGGSSQVLVNGLAVRLHTDAGETTLPFGQLEAWLKRGSSDELTFDLDLPLTASANAPALRAHASLPAGSARVELSASIPAFDTAALPAIAGAPALPLRATVGLDIAAQYDLAGGALVRATAAILARDGEIVVPAGNSPIRLPLQLVDLRAVFDGGTQKGKLEKGTLRLAGIDADIPLFEFELGARPTARWRLDLAQVRAATALALMPAEMRAGLPLSPAALDTIAFDRAFIEGDITVSRTAPGAWASDKLSATGGLDVRLGAASVPVTWHALQDAPAGPIEVAVQLPSVHPSEWPDALLAGTPVGAIDVPLAVDAAFTLSPTGSPQSARFSIGANGGSLKPLQPGPPAVPLRRIELRAQSTRFPSGWEITAAELALAEGARASLTGGKAELGSDRLSFHGDFSASNLGGEFAAAWLPAGAWKPLSDAGIEPRDAVLTQAAARLDLQATAKKGGGWTPQVASANASVGVRIHEASLNLSATANLPAGGEQIAATFDLAEFRASALRLILPGGFAPDALDFPMSLHGVARATLNEGLVSADVQVHSGPGRVKIPGDNAGNFPVQSFALDAAYDAAGKRADIRSLRLDAGVFHIDVPRASLNLAVRPYVLEGEATLAPFALQDALALWPAGIRPELRATVASALQAGGFRGGKIDLSATYDPAGPGTVKINRARGDAAFTGIGAVFAQIPGPASLASVTATLDYPRATIEANDLVLPGVKLARTHIELGALDSKASTASIVSAFDADLAAAAVSWKLPATAKMTGRATGEFRARGEQGTDAYDVSLALDAANAHVALPGVPNIAPSTATFSARVSGITGEGSGAVDFTLEASQWLDAALKIAGKASLAANTHEPTSIDIASYQHGRTRMQGRVLMPGSGKIDARMTGPFLDAAPLMRAGLAAADGFGGAAAAVPPAKGPLPAAGAPPAGAAAAAPAPAIPTVTADISIDEIEFGPGRSARNVVLRTRLENAWPAALSFHADASAGNPLGAELNGPARDQKFSLQIGDSAEWMRIVTSPWGSTAPTGGQFAGIVAQLMKVPAIVSGGNVLVEAEIRREEPEWFRGSVHVSRATLVRPPRVLNLLALKSGKSLQVSPLMEQFSIGSITVGATQLHAGAIALTGPGLVNNLKVRTVAYGLVDDKLAVDGDYFGVGFNVVGTLADPQVFLKDSNTLLRALGNRNEFDFDPPPPAAKPEPKKP